ncbi:hypothetical protein Tco_0822848 [Tanacetum coccineum]|uniref:SMI1/KNR4 family protein n=1 Tax=Tanacetum coccineum TaxID=301880 RepID=A0ABQ5AKS8_9ASTR
MTIGLNLPKQILEAQTEALKPENLTAEDVEGVGYRVMSIKNLPAYYSFPTEISRMEVEKIHHGFSSQTPKTTNGYDTIWTLGGSGGESFWEEGDDFGVDVLRFHTCLTDILGFLEKLEWWFEQDIDDEEEEDEEGEGGSEV